MSNPTIIIIDLFCGAGGLTTGAEIASINGLKVAKVIACVNHDANAIESHFANHPQVQHFTEDVRTLDLDDLGAQLWEAKLKYPEAMVLLWASLECTNFSIAKGGQSRDGDSRTLAQSLYMQYNVLENDYQVGDSYIQVLNPDYIYIENVKEFKTWGPLAQKIDKFTGKLLFDKNGNPIMIPDPEHLGEYFDEWRSAIDSFGYCHEHKLLNSKDFGACQSRLRFFMQFAKIGLPITWPQATHGIGLKPYRAIKEVLDFSNEGYSILHRSHNMDIPKRQRKDLVNKTLERVYAGLVKFIAKGDDSFVSKYFSGRPEHKNISIDGPCGTIKTIDNHAVVKTVFISKYMGNNAATGVNNGKSVDEPSITVTCQNRLALVQAFGVNYYSSGQPAQSIDKPSGTVTTVSKLTLVQTFGFKYYGSGQNLQDTNEPSGTLTTKDRMAVVNINYDAAALAAPGIKKVFAIMPSGWGWPMHSTEQPSPTVIARQDKNPIYLVQIEQGEMGIAVFENDSPIVEKIKFFMAAFGIVDIKMRMLTLSEQMSIQGFPKDYILKGTKTEQKKYNGNAVEVHQATACIQAVASALVGELVTN